MLELVNPSSIIIFASFICKDTATRAPWVSSKGIIDSDYGSFDLSEILDNDINIDVRTWLVCVLIDVVEGSGGHRSMPYFA